MTNEARQMILKVRKGEPFRPGEEIPLGESALRFGRKGASRKPDVEFDSPNISRFHAEIYFENDRYYMYHPTECTNGISINKKPLPKSEHIELHHGDRIVFAKDQVQLIFWNKNDLGTPPWDDDRHGEPPREIRKVEFDPHTHKLTYKDMSTDFNGREYRLFCLLYNSLGNVVDKERIKIEVWTERALDEHGKRLADDAEVNTLVHLLRDKLENEGWQDICTITTVRSHGYRLDIYQP